MVMERVGSEVFTRTQVEALKSIAGKRHPKNISERTLRSLRVRGLVVLYGETLTEYGKQVLEQVLERQEQRERGGGRIKPPRRRRLKVAKIPRI